MNADYEPVDVRTERRRPWTARLIVPALAFLLGLAMMAWLLSRWDDAARFVGIGPAAETPELADEPGEEPELAPEIVSPPPGAERIVIDPEISRRVNLLERRVAETRQQAQATVSHADRAEGLLVAFAARRALDRGVQLGYIEALLRQRFGETQPQAVGMVITAARNPVTLQELQEGLQTVGPQLTGAPPNQNLWGAFKTELNSLVTVRRQGTPPTDPAERLRRATRRLEAGQVDVALAEVLRMPGRDHARGWIEGWGGGGGAPRRAAGGGF
jgi:hypothetical protein